ncbi:MAG: segregation/condensation protein A, partial [Candidatus Woesearchaeota archaeon]|nr:segregation/condensation protein A [Candidatus Woesearchaeota archaeon]
SLLSKKYLDTIKRLKEMDLVYSGKVVLAAALLLKIKSTRLLSEDLDHFDNLISGKSEDLLFEDSIAESGEREKIDITGIGLIPKTPQPRKRKVSIYDLVDALRLALDTDRRRLLRIRPIEMTLPEKSFDISAAMKSLYSRINEFFVSGKAARLTFMDLVPSQEKKDKILTFVPLLHLTNQRKIDLLQDVPFGEIEVRLNTEKQIEKELAEESGESAGSGK